MEQLKNWVNKIHESFFFPLIVFGLLTIIMLSSLILNNTLILSYDTIFHFNRFYDTAEQIRNGNFNYFQMNYGFLQTGRIVNALYGPLVAYIFGFILLLSYNWIVFEIIISSLVMIIAAFSMYWLCKTNGVKRDYSILMGSLYMIGSSVFSWVVTQQFTGVGAAVMPLFFIGVTSTLQKLKIPVLTISIGMAILIQTHILSSLIAFASSVPIILVALALTSEKKIMIRDGIISIIITLALTSNVWGAIISVFKQNYLIPTFPEVNMQLYTLSLHGESLQNVMKPMELLLFAYVIYYVVTRWTKLNYVVKTLGLVGFVFLIISTNIIPWIRLESNFPKLTTLIQFPRRFSVIPFVLFILLLGMILSNDKYALTLKPLRHPSRIFTWVIFFFVLILNMQANARLMNLEVSQTIAMKENSQSVIPMVHAFRYNKKVNYNFKEDFESPNKSMLINDIVKTTPDYLPTNQAVNEDNYSLIHPYIYNYRQLIKHNLNIKGGYSKKVNKDGSLSVTWYNHHKKTTRYRVTVVKYAATQLVLNGKKINPVRVSQVGAVTVNAKPGKNVLRISYKTGLWMDVIFLVTIISWIGIVGFMIIKKYKKG